MANLRIISADSHVVEPANLWETSLHQRKYRDQAPKVIRTEKGLWVIVAPGGIRVPRCSDGSRPASAAKNCASTWARAESQPSQRLGECP